METCKTPFLLQKQRRQGFTLTEIAIVLGMIGLILGAVWVGAAGVYANAIANNFSQSMMQYIVAVRSACTNVCAAPPTIANTIPDVYSAGDANSVGMSVVIPGYIILHYNTPTTLNNGTKALFNGLVAAATATGSFLAPSGDIVAPTAAPSCAGYTATNTAPSCGTYTDYTATYFPSGGTNACTSASTAPSGWCSLVTNTAVTPGTTYTFGFSQSF